MTAPGPRAVCTHSGGSWDGGPCAHIAVGLGGGAEPPAETLSGSLDSEEGNASEGTEVHLVRREYHSG